MVFICPYDNKVCDNGLNCIVGDANYGSTFVVCPRNPHYDRCE